MAKIFCFCFVQDALYRLALRVLRLGGDFIAGREQLAQDRLLAHDFGIAANVRRAGYVLRQLVEVHNAAHLLRLALGFAGVRTP